MLKNESETNEIKCLKCCKWKVKKPGELDLTVQESKCLEQIGLEGSS